jgi:hypothetical protein
MSDTSKGQEPPRESRGFNINFHPLRAGWGIELMPNPQSVGEALRPRWVSQFEVDGFAPGREFTTGEALSLLAVYLEDIAAERLDPVGFVR